MSDVKGKSLVRTDRFIHATRDSGYKSTAHSLAELIDNAIQANARNIHVELVGVEQDAPKRGRPTLPRAVEVFIVDDGEGMTPAILNRSLRFGDTNRFGDRGGLGRFGMGLPNASVSQARRFEVYTWRAGRRAYWTYVDVDEVAASRQILVPQPKRVPMPAPYQAWTDTPSGTLVVWKKPDRLDEDGKVETLTRSLLPILGRMFRYYIREGVRLTINTSEVPIVDPLYPGDAEEAKPQVYQLPGGEVTARFALLPFEWQRKYARDREMQRQLHLDLTQGFSVVRHKREVDLISSPYQSRHWTDSWYRVEISFPPSLDELFGVSHTKQQVRLPSGSLAYETLKPGVVEMVNTLRERIVTRSRNVLRSEPEADGEAQAGDTPPVAGEAPEQAPQPATEAPSPVHHLEVESRPGEPVYRVQEIGDQPTICLNTAHPYYQRVFQRLEQESETAPVGLGLFLMAIARAEAESKGVQKKWYTQERTRWSRILEELIDTHL